MCLQLVRKRLIALHLHSPIGGSKEDPKLSIQEGIVLLVDHLEVVYNDAEAWSELASAYEKLGLFVSFLFYRCCMHLTPSAGTGCNNAFPAWRT